jgi:hypothetical protein
VNELLDAAPFLAALAATAICLAVGMWFEAEYHKWESWRWRREMRRARSER